MPEMWFGPPTAAEATVLFDHIRSGSILFADSARAYIRPAQQRGLVLRCVDHGKGDYARREDVRGKLRSVSTHGIDGAWGRLKVWFAARVVSLLITLLDMLRSFSGGRTCLPVTCL